MQACWRSHNSSHLPTLPIETHYNIFLPGLPNPPLKSCPILGEPPTPANPNPPWKLSGPLPAMQPMGWLCPAPSYPSQHWEESRAPLQLPPPGPPPVSEAQWPQPPAASLPKLGLRDHCILLHSCKLSERKSVKFLKQHPIIDIKDQPTALAVNFKKGELSRQFGSFSSGNYPSSFQWFSINSVKLLSEMEHTPLNCKADPTIVKFQGKFGKIYLGETVNKFRINKRNKNADLELCIPLALIALMWAKSKQDIGNSCTWDKFRKMWKLQGNQEMKKTPASPSTSVTN